jgi:(E)-4-hydroxy-3-methylbut-2-enyl-diphosphate synthase
LEGRTTPCKVSVLGCVVNGPGEAREADIGIAAGNGKGVIFRNGEIVRNVTEAEMVDALLEEIDLWEQEQALKQPGELRRDGHGRRKLPLVTA